MVEALLIGDRIAVLEEGRLAQVGSPGELLRAPANEYVARLMETPRRQANAIEHLMGDEAEALLAHRFAVINVWKPIRGPVQESPLAFCDAQSIGPDDLVPTDLAYRDRTGEVYSMAFNERHRWFYYSAMRPDEALLLKCYDSDPTLAQFTAHSAFDDPSSAPDAPSRESIEVRAYLMFEG